MSISQPVVVVTGSSQGLGFHVARVLLSNGFAVVLCARSSEPLAAASRHLKPLGPVLAAAGDVSDPNFTAEVVDRTVRAFGRIDALVNNASTLGDLPLPALADTSSENLRHAFEVNAVAPMLWAQRLLPHLQRRTRAVIAGISSDAALAGYPNWGAYGASKAASDLLHRTLASEWAHSGIAIYTSDPGDMATAMHEAAAPGDTGLADPAAVARALYPLFDHLLTDTSPRYPTGLRFRVAENQLQCAGAGA